MSNDCPPTAACTPSTSMFCDEKLVNLPKLSRIRLVGVDGKCLHEFPSGVKGFVFFDGAGGAVVSNDPTVNLPQLVTYAKGPNDQYLKDTDGKLLEDDPPGFPYLLVEVEAGVEGVDCCGSGGKLRRWRGHPGKSGFVFWDPDLNQFVMRGLFDEGIKTISEIEEAESLKLLGTDPAKDDDDEKTAMHLVTGVPDLVTLDADGKASSLNPEALPGVVYFDPNTPDAGGNPTPRVLSLCELGKDGCGDKTTPTNLIGCDEEGLPTSTADTPETVPDGAASHVLADGGSGYVPAPMGLTFWPAGGTLKSASAQTGAKTLTISESDIELATGVDIPEHAKYVAVRARIAVTGTEAGVAKTAELSVGGKSLALAEAQWQDPDNAGTDKDHDTGAAIVALTGANAMSLTIDHPDDTNSEFDYAVYMDGFFVEVKALS